MRPPVSGDWKVLSPPGHPPDVHDLVGVDPSGGPSAVRYLLGLARAEEVPGWGRPVVAPLDGVVAGSWDDEPDRLRLMPLLHAPATMLRPLFQASHPEKLTGNHVVLSTDGGYVLLAHLRRGSVTVGEGDRVEAGQLLGRVGNSGNTMGPHLHIQVMDGPDPMTAGVLPFRLTRFSQLTPGGYVDRVDAPLPAGTARVRLPGREDS